VRKGYDTKTGGSAKGQRRQVKDRVQLGLPGTEKRAAQTRCTEKGGTKGKETKGGGKGKKID